MSVNRLFGVAAIAIVIAGLVLAFLFLGTPSHARLVAFDDLRIQALQQMTSLLHEHYPNGGLPERLLPGMTLHDPVTKVNYEYRRVDPERYVLCAVFATAETPDRGQVYPPGARWIARDWRHRAGRTCYELDVTTSPFAPPRPLPASP